MIWPLIKLDLRKVLPIYIVPVVIQVGFILITFDILDTANVTILVLAMIQGWLLAWCIFRDAHNTRSFLFSRSWSPARIFWNRWILAITLQIGTVLLIYIILAAGTRTILHQFHLPYFPMVERFELSILWPIALAPAITFHIIMFLMLRSKMVSPDGACRWRVIVVIIVLGFILMMFIGAIRDFMVIPGMVGTGLGTSDLALVYTAVLAILCTAASLNCYKNMEIES
ncbi:MAG: hypothetical protein GY845_18105 [Planctomycetes bacterium]|nr:hypothetical protein [Planctomycetota bacterium]